MKKYLFSLVIFLLTGLLLLLFSFDESGFSYFLLPFVLLLFGMPSLILKILSRVSLRVGYWDVLTLLVFGGLQIFYSKYLWDIGFWYSNFTIFNKIMSSSLVIVPIIMIIYLLSKKHTLSFN